MVHCSDNISSKQKRHNGGLANKLFPLRGFIWNWCLCPGLAYCRHLSTVRTHLSALVNHNIVPPDRPCEASGGLSREVWSKYQKDCKVGHETCEIGWTLLSPRLWKWQMMVAHTVLVSVFSRHLWSNRPRRKPVIIYCYHQSGRVRQWSRTFLSPQWQWYNMK